MVNIKELITQFPAEGIQKISNKTFTFSCFVVPKEHMATTIPGIKTLMFVYFLIDSRESKYDKRTIYIGKSTQGPIRFFDHKRRRKWFDKAIIFTASKDVFNSDVIGELEGRLIEKYNDSGDYKVENDQKAHAERSDVECDLFEEQILYLMNYLDYPVDVRNKKKIDEAPTPIKKEDLTMSYVTCSITEGTELFYKGKQFDARCLMKDGQFILLKGSKISPNITQSVTDTETRKIRNKHSQYISSNFVTTGDILFKSSSSAAKFVCGSSQNGKICWKDKNGVILRDLLIKY